MKNQNIITDASPMNKDDYKKYGQNIVTGCGPTNTNFTFIGTVYTLCATRFGTWMSLNSSGEVSGDKIIIQKADDALILSKVSYTLLADEVNLQAMHDLVKLKSSGGILTSEGGSLGILKKAIILDVVSTVIGEATITIDTMEQSVGTIVRWTDLTANTVMEHEFFAQKHTIHLDGLISGHQYEIDVAHKGSVRKVLYSNPVKIYIQ